MGFTVMKVHELDQFVAHREGRYSLVTLQFDDLAERRHRSRVADADGEDHVRSGRHSVAGRCLNPEHESGHGTNLAVTTEDGQHHQEHEARDHRQDRSGAAEASEEAGAELVPGHVASGGRRWRGSPTPPAAPSAS